MIGRCRIASALLLASWALSGAVGCTALQDWGDDHIVLNELELLDPNTELDPDDLWIRVLNNEAEPFDCSFAMCQNIVRNDTYVTIGDFDTATRAALDVLNETWVPTSDVDVFTGQLARFQLRDEIAIDTTTGTAVMWLKFERNARITADEYHDAIFVGVSSDKDF